MVESVIWNCWRPERAAARSARGHLLFCACIACTTSMDVRFPCSQAIGVDPVAPWHIALAGKSSRRDALDARHFITQVN